MPKTRVNCPNCRQPIVADLEQLFDVGADPSLKQLFLSGMYNMVQCPSCGYQGNLATPIVYHDPAKELLLTYFPPELNMPVNEQERIIGPFITKVTNSLPQEKRKAYLLRPQTMFTLQTLVEKVLEADGITKEMLQAQQQRLNLLQRLLGAPEGSVEEIARQEDKLIDRDFFMIAGRLTEAASMSGDQEAARRLSDLQKKLMTITTFGQELQSQTKEVEAVVQALQEAGPELTREKLLDMAINAPNDLQLNVLTSLARRGMDYAFFQLLSERIDRARGEGRQRLIELREKLLALTREVDKQIEARVIQSRQQLNMILASPNVTEELEKNLTEVDEIFINTLHEELETARKQGDLSKIAKLKEIDEVIQKAAAPPPEVELIEELVNARDEREMRAIFEQHRSEITPEFLEILTTVLVRSQNSKEEQEISLRLQVIYQMALRYSMEMNLNRTG